MKARINVRDRLLTRFRRSIVRHGYPRIVLSFLLALSGLFGLLLSFLFLHLGLTHMGLRYLACIALAYLLFLGLLRLWASGHLSEFDLSGLDVPGSGSGGSGGLGGYGGDGGGFSGGGSSGSWEPEGGSGISEGSDMTLNLDLDEGWILAVPFLLVAGSVFAVLYAISAAPVLLAEVALDVAIAAGAYRRIKKLEPRYWAAGAFRRTWVVALALALFIGGGGWALQAAAPDAHTIGAAWSVLSVD